MPETPSPWQRGAYWQASPRNSAQLEAVVQGNVVATIDDSGLTSDLSNSLVTPTGGVGTRTLGDWLVFVREKLTANRTYYIWPAGGNDAADGGSGTPWKTGQYAADWCRQHLDFNGYTVTLQFIAGDTAFGGIVWDGPIPGGGLISIRGQSLASPFSLTRAGGNVFEFKNGCQAKVDTGFKLSTTSSGDCIKVTGSGTNVQVMSVEFGACAGNHENVGENAKVTNTGPQNISGGAVAFRHFTMGGSIVDDNNVVTLTNTPAFSAYFVGGANNSSYQCLNISFSGSASAGAKFLIHHNASIRTDTNNPELFPGTTGNWLIRGGSNYDYLVNKQISVTAGSNSLAAANTESIVLADATGGVVTINLPAASTANGVFYVIKKIDASANNVTIDPNSTELIDGASTLSFNTQWMVKTIRCDGSAWYVIG